MVLLTDSPFYTPGLFWDSGTVPISFIQGTSSLDLATAFNSGGLSTTTMQSYCDINFPYDDSTAIKATITSIPNGLCRFAFFTVVPSPASVNQFSTLKESVTGKFPFNYVTSMTSTWEGLVASSTDNAPNESLGLHDLGIGSTTAIGNFLPNFTMFSSSTVEKYISQSTLSILKALAGIAILLTFFADIFFTARNMLQ